MRALVPGLSRHPLALDLRLDAQVELPEEVAREIERAASVLTRVSAHPYGTAAWKAYQRRFYERYGIGTMVPLNEVVADSGTGFPDGYPGTQAGAAPPRRLRYGTTPWCGWLRPPPSTAATRWCSPMI